MKIKNVYTYLFIFFIFVGIIAPTLFTDGMFMDGLIYATIARNLSVGIGNFWDLKFTETVFPHFHEHPPLAMGLQSILFDVFGDSLYVERFYSLATFFFTGLLLVLIWKKAVKSEYRTTAWLPLIFWLAIPLNIWAVSNNMLENTMMIFTSACILLLMHSIEHKRLLFIIPAGFSLSLAFLTKGFTALFPLGFFFWLLLFRLISFSRFISSTFLLIFFFLMPFALLFLIDKEAIGSISSYLQIQVIGSLNNVQTVENRFFILIRLLKELIPIFALLLIITGIFWKKIKVEGIAKSGKVSAYLFLAIGLSGVVPIMISMKQSGFYILATFPFFAIFFAMLVAKPISNWYRSISVKSKGFQIFKITGVLLMIATIAISILQFGKIGRDKQTIEDVYAIEKVVPEKSSINILPEMQENWSLHAYFYRYAYISLDSDTNALHPFLLSPKNAVVSNENYSRLPLKLEKFELYKKRDR